MRWRDSERRSGEYMVRESRKRGGSISRTTTVIVIVIVIRDLYIKYERGLLTNPTLLSRTLSLHFGQS